MCSPMDLLKECVWIATLLNYFKFASFAAGAGKLLIDPQGLPFQSC